MCDILYYRELDELQYTKMQSRMKSIANGRNGLRPALSSFI